MGGAAQIQLPTPAALTGKVEEFEPAIQFIGRGIKRKFKPFSPAVGQVWGVAISLEQSIAKFDWFEFAWIPFCVRSWGLAEQWPE